MLKGKALTMLITSVSLIVGLAVAAIGATFAWYSTHTAQTSGFELNANGVLVVYFDDEPVVFTGALKPAVAVKDKIIENETTFNVLTSGGNISQVATTATATTYFEYLNSTSVDPDDAGKIGADVTISAFAKLVRQDDSEKDLSLTRDIAVLADFSVEYLDESILGFDPTEGFGESFHVAGDCRITIEVTVYFRQPDDLIDPEILTAKSIIVGLTSLVEPDDE